MQREKEEEREKVVEGAIGMRMLKSNRQASIICVISKGAPGCRPVTRGRGGEGPAGLIKI